MKFEEKKEVEEIVDNTIEETITDLEKLIPEWKKEYRAVYKNYFTDDLFIIWRPLKRVEYKNLSKEDDISDTQKFQDKIIKTCALYPNEEEIENMLEDFAGLGLILSDEILRLSAFGISETQEL